MNFTRFLPFAAVAIALVAGSQAHSVALQYGKYYDETVVQDALACSPTFCRMYFSQLPANKLVMVRKVHCTFISAKPMLRAALNVAATSGGSAISRHLPLTMIKDPAVSPNTFFYATVDIETQWLMGQGRFPFVELEKSDTGSSYSDCTLIGEMVDPI